MDNERRYPPVLFAWYFLDTTAQESFIEFLLPLHWITSLYKQDKSFAGLSLPFDKRITDGQSDRQQTDGFEDDKNDLNHQYNRVCKIPRKK